MHDQHLIQPDLRRSDQSAEAFGLFLVRRPDEVVVGDEDEGVLFIGRVSVGVGGWRRDMMERGIEREEKGREGRRRGRGKREGEMRI